MNWSLRIARAVLVAPPPSDPGESLEALLLLVFLFDSASTVR